MRSKVHISLPPPLQKWVTEQMRQRGFHSAGEMVRDVIRRERERTLRFQIDQSLANALATPVTEMVDQDWAEIRRAGRALARKRNAT